MNTFAAILLVLAILSAIVTFISTFTEEENTKNVKKYAALFTLIFSLCSIIVQFKVDIDETKAIEKRQTVLLENISKTITNTDPLAQSTIQIEWVEGDSECHRALLDYFEERKLCIKVGDEDKGLDQTTYRIGDSCNTGFNGFSSWHFFFWDTSNYMMNKDSLFILDKISDDFTPSMTLKQLIRIEFGLVQETEKIEMARFVDIGDGEFSNPQDIFSGKYTYQINPNQDTSFTSLKNFNCFLIVERPKYPMNISHMKLVNYNGSKTIRFNCEKILSDSRLEWRRSEVYLCSKPEFRLSK